MGGIGDDILDGGKNDDVLLGSEGDDTLIGDSGSDLMLGGDGNDLFLFGRGDGDDRVDGGSGTGSGSGTGTGGNWVDTIRLDGFNNGPSNSLQGRNSWVLEVDQGGTFTIDQESKELVFDGDASGTITLGDGSQLVFDNIDKIEWG